MMINNTKLLVIILCSMPNSTVLGDGPAVKSPWNTLTQSTTTKIPSPEINEIRRATDGEYCSMSELSMDVHKISYTWILDGLLSYLSRLPQNAACEVGSKHRKIQVNVTDMVFDTIALPGNWSASVSTNEDCGLDISLTYEALVHDMTIIGDLTVKHPSGYFMKPQGPKETTTAKYPIYDSRQQNSRIKFFTEFKWEMDNFYLNRLTNVYRGEVNPSISGSGSLLSTNDVQDWSSNNGQLILIFHMEVIKTFPATSEFSKDCHLDD